MLQAQLLGKHPSVLAGTASFGERGRTAADEPAWNVRVWWNPWARLIFLGPAIMALGGLLSLLDRRLRLGVNRKAAA